MKRGQGSIPTDGSGDPIPAAQAEYDDRLEDARAMSRRGFIFGAIGGGMGLAGAAALLYRMVEGAPAPLLAEMCRGDVLAVRSIDAPGSRPRVEDISEDLKEWVRGAREVLTDPHALARQAWRTYNMTRKSSQAEAVLKDYHDKNKLNELARTKTIHLEGQTAFPQGGVANSNTWLCEWSEVTRGLDGVTMSTVPWRMTVSFVIRPPQTADDLKKNPHGIFVESFNWEKVDRSRSQLVEIKP